MSNIIHCYNTQTFNQRTDKYVKTREFVGLRQIYFSN